MAAYYNEIDPYAAQWLRNLIAAGHIAAGEVDERDIRDVSPAELAGFDQCHFFAGIGGWSRALRLAGIPDDAKVWTGSCPCQPFSSAGSGGGFADERHLWPSWFHLINVVRPAKVFGEQVASPDALEWFDLVCADLETAGYAVGVADLCAAGIGAPHIRQRLWFVADAERGPAEFERLDVRGEAGANESETRQRERVRSDIGTGGDLGGPGATFGFWRAADWLFCRDGKWRPVEPGTFPLAHGIPGRVGRLRAYGNAIVPQVAAEFVRATL